MVATWTGDAWDTLEGVFRRPEELVWWNYCASATPPQVDLKPALDEPNMMALAGDLRGTLEDMANRCSAPMDIWDRHAGAVLRAADALRSIPALTACAKAAEAEAARLRGLLSEAERGLTFILPMAKGYAHEHPVGRNYEIVRAVEEDLERFRAALTPGGTDATD